MRPMSLSASFVPDERVEGGERTTRIDNYSRTRNCRARAARFSLYSAPRGLSLNAPVFLATGSRAPYRYSERGGMKELALVPGYTINLLLGFTPD